MDPVGVVLIKVFRSAKTARFGYLEASGMRFGYMLQDNSRILLFISRETMELFIAYPGIDTKIREVNIAFYTLVCPLVFVVGLLQDWYYNEQPTGRPVPGTYIRTAGSYQQTVSYYHLRYFWECHQGIQGSGSKRKQMFLSCRWQSFYISISAKGQCANQYRT